MNHYQSEGNAYAAARDATERQNLVECERELRNAIESWYYAQKRIVNIVECNRNLRNAWEAFQDQARIVGNLAPIERPKPARVARRCLVCDALESDQVGDVVYLCADHIPEHDNSPHHANNRIKALTSAVQGFSLDLAEIADAVGLDKNECLEPPAVVHAVKQMAARLKAYEPQPTLPQS